MQNSRKTLFVLFVSLAFAGGAFFTYLALPKSKPMPAFATVLPEPLPLPEFSLLDQDGEPFGRDSLKGQWSILFFGFTHCPDICPATLQQLSLARAKVAERAGQAFPRIILISVDPERDTPSVLRDYIAHFGSGVAGVTGNIDELKKLTTGLGIFFATSAASNGGYSVDHSAVVLLINPAGEFHALFSAPHNVDQFVTDIPLLVDPE